MLLNCWKGERSDSWLGLQGWPPKLKHKTSNSKFLSQEAVESESHCPKGLCWRPNSSAEVLWSGSHPQSYTEPPSHKESDTTEQLSIEHSPQETLIHMYAALSVQSISSSKQVARTASQGKPQTQIPDTYNQMNTHPTLLLWTWDAQPNLPPLMRTFTVLSLGYFIKFYWGFGHFGSPFTLFEWPPLKNWTNYIG